VALPGDVFFLHQEASDGVQRTRTDRVQVDWASPTESVGNQAMEVST
jgi:hypothetical protein